MQYLNKYIYYLIRECLFIYKFKLFTLYYKNMTQNEYNVRSNSIARIEILSE